MVYAQAPPLPPQSGQEFIGGFITKMAHFPYDTSSCHIGPKECAEKALKDYIYGELRYPKEAYSSCVEGMAVVSFIVKEDGTVDNITLVRDLGAGTGEEALRIVEKMVLDFGKWIPGERRGKATPIQFNLPIIFSLDR